MYKYKILFHIPHDSHRFPKELMDSLCVTKEEFLRYHHIMRDTCANSFVPAHINAEVISFDVSRLLCDVERFRTAAARSSLSILIQGTLSSLYQKSGMVNAAKIGEIKKSIAEALQNLIGSLS